MVCVVEVRCILRIVCGCLTLVVRCLGGRSRFLSTVVAYVWTSTKRLRDRSTPIRRTGEAAAYAE